MATRRKANINIITARVQQALQRSMDNHTTLSLENLALEEETVNPKKRSKEKAKGNKNRHQNAREDQKQKTSKSSEARTTPRYLDPTQRAWYPPTVPSYQSLPIPPSEGDQSFPSALTRHAFTKDGYRGSAPPVNYSLGQGFMPINRSSQLPVPRAGQSSPTRSPLGESLCSNGYGLGPTIHKSSLSVSACCGIPSSRIDKHYKYSKTRAPTDLKSAQPRRTDARPLTKHEHSPFSAVKPLKPEIWKRPNTSDAAAIQPSGEKLKTSPLIQLPAPVPTPIYLALAHATPTVLPQPQRLLLVLDLNGTLICRRKASQSYTPRPSLEAFLKYAFANHSLLIWSSATPNNVTGICARLFSPEQRRRIVGVWARDTLGLTAAQYKLRVQIYKRLNSIWDDEGLQLTHPGFNRGGRWGQHNTLLIDDSVLKASAQPFNHVEVPEFVKGGEEIEGNGKDVLAQIAGYLEEARRWSDVSAFVKEERFANDLRWKWDWESEGEKKQKESRRKQTAGG